MLEKLMDKNQVLNFDLWATYWNYLLSLQEIVKQELQKKLGHDAEINSWIKSLGDFFSEAGEPQGDAPELEEIYFQLKNHVSQVRFCVSFGKVAAVYTELINGDNHDSIYYLADEFHKINLAFSEKMIEIIAEWLKEAVVSEAILTRFSHYGSDI